MLRIEAAIDAIAKNSIATMRRTVEGVSESRRRSRTPRNCYIDSKRAIEYLRLNTTVQARKRSTATGPGAGMRR